MNTEFIDRIILAAEREIHGKQTVNVSVVQTLIDTLRSIDSSNVIEAIDTSVQDNQDLLNYD